MEPSLSDVQSPERVERTTVKTRLLILSDTHSTAPLSPSNQRYAYRHPLPNADVILHAGDLTERGYKDEYTDTINFLASHPAELKLVIAGNHDITLDEEYVLGPHGTRHARHSLDDCRAVKEAWCGLHATEHGIRYLEEGTYSFKLRSGASFTVHASPYQPIFDNWAFSYERNQDRFNPPPASTTTTYPHLPVNLLALASNPVPGALPPFPPPSSSSKPQAPDPIPPHPVIDILLTHGPPLGILDTVVYPPYYNVGCAHLLRAVERCRPLLHAFGHIHEGWGGQMIEWENGKVRDLLEGPDGGERRDEREVVLRERCVRVDLTASGEGGGVQWGRQTAFVNASVMDFRYRPVNAPWVVDVEFAVDEKMKGDGGVV